MRSPTAVRERVGAGRAVGHTTDRPSVEDARASGELVGQGGGGRDEPSPDEPGRARAGARPRGSGPATRHRRTTARDLVGHRPERCRDDGDERGSSATTPRANSSAAAGSPPVSNCSRDRHAVDRHVRRSGRDPPRARGRTGETRSSGVLDREILEERDLRAPWRRRRRSGAAGRASRSRARSRGRGRSGVAIAIGSSGGTPPTGSLGTPRRDGGIGRRAGLKNP